MDLEWNKRLENAQIFTRLRPLVYITGLALMGVTHHRKDEEKTAKVEIASFFSLHGKHGLVFTRFG